MPAPSDCLISLPLFFNVCFPGVSIIKEGDQGQKFYIIKTGAAKVSANGQDVGELSQGTYFGEMALLNNDVRKATVTALQKCECFVLDRKTFQRIKDSVGTEMKSEADSRQRSVAESAASAAGKFLLIYI